LESGSAKWYIHAQGEPVIMNETINSHHPIRFGAFELGLREGELRKQGLRIKLQQQPLQLLMMLLEHPGEIVTREELRKNLWPAETFVDFDHGLNKAITKIREALGDSADSPRFIETLPRRGYRFIAPVSGTPDSEGAVSVPSVTSESPAAADAPLSISRNWARGLFVFIQAGCLLMYGIALYYLPAIQRLSVFLPIRNTAVFVALVGLCGAPLHIYLLAAVGLDYSGSGRLFQRLFLAILLVDWAWSASPLLLFHRLGELSLLFTAGLAFLPFAQRTLLASAYAEGGGRSPVIRAQSSHS
jgi:cholera toxin transcriptional activator